MSSPCFFLLLSTFMSNMLYSCSVLYKSRLPMVCVFNKVDVVACEFALEWMTDFEAYLEALDNTSSAGSGEWWMVWWE